MQQLHRRGVLCAAFLAVLGALTVWVEPAHAQLLQGSITGNVTDASQAAVVGAKVVATEVDEEELISETPEAEALQEVMFEAMIRY